MEIDVNATEKLRAMLAETSKDGIKIGWQAAADALEAAMPNVAKENQTWASAIAMLRLIDLDNLLEVKALVRFSAGRSPPRSTTEID